MSAYPNGGPTLHRFGLALLLVVGVICTPPALAIPSPSPPIIDLEELTLRAELRMVKSGDYFQTLEGAYWASSVGERIVPILADLLEKEKHYLADSTGPHTAFPFNVIWALGRIASPASIAVLKKYQAGKHDHDASFAIKAALLRQKFHDKEVGVTSREDVPLYTSASHASKVLKTLKRGTPVKALKYRVINKTEKNARGGEAHFDQVKLLPKGPMGFIERAGDDFTSIY